MFSRDELLNALVIAPNISVEDIGNSGGKIIGGYMLGELASPFDPTVGMTDDHIGTTFPARYYTMESAIADAAYWWNNRALPENFSDIDCHGMIIYQYRKPLIILCPQDQAGLFDSLTLAHLLWRNISDEVTEIRTREIRQIMRPSQQWPPTMKWVEEYEDAFAHILSCLFAIQPYMEEVESLLQDSRANPKNKMENRDKIQKLSRSAVKAMKRASVRHLATHGYEFLNDMFDEDEGSEPEND